MLRRRDRIILAVLLALPALACAALALSGRALFWGDLSYIHHPWRALVAEALQRGETPLWNPFNYLGMPLAAQQQSGAWYPGSLPFHLFPFPAALSLYIPAHLGLAALFAFLWLRREGLGRVAAAGGAALWAGSGVALAHVPLVNQLSTLAYFPAFFLFKDRPWALGLGLACAFLTGYPTMLAGAGAAFLWGWLARGRPPLRAWAQAALWALAAGALLLLPALDLASDSRRGGGMALEETLLYGFVPGDWRQWVGPLALGWEGFSPSVLWWKTCYIGALGLAAAALGAARLRPRTLAAGGLYLSAVGLLVLGGSNPVSKALWTHAAPLRFIRYPGHIAYLALPALAYAAAAGLHGRRWRLVLAALMGAELLTYAVNAQPLMPGRIFAEPGPLVRRLQAGLGPHRYHLSPRALHWGLGRGPDAEAALWDWRRRLYGLTNAPFHLEAVGGFGEPLVPQANYRHMDLIFGRPGLDAAAGYLPWADAAIAMTRERLPSARLRWAGEETWQLYRVPGRLSRAWWFGAAAGAALPAEAPLEAASPWLRVPPAGLGGLPLAFTRQGFGKFRVDGDTRAGWLFLSEPLQPGWRLWLNGSRARAEPAMGPFQKLRVPPGPWILRARYEPAAWLAGLAITLATLLGSCAWWFRRLCA